MKIDLPRTIIYFLGTVAGALAFVYLGEAFKTQNPVQDFFVTVYSILVGFLVAVMAVLFDPGVILRGSWRIAHLQRAELMRRFIRHVFIFYVYLITLGLIFLLKVSKWIPNDVEQVVPNLAAFFAISSFIWSFDLPISLFNIQRDKLDAIVESRKANL